MEMLFLGFETAAILAERNARRGFRDFVPTVINDLRQATPSRKSILSFPLEELGLEEEYLDVLVPHGASRNSHSALRYHRIGGTLPENSFLRGRGNVFISSPELTLLELSLSLDEYSWLKLAYRFTGKYSADINETYGLAERPPLTSVTRLAAYFCTAREYGMRGARRSLQLLKHVRDGAASPREAELDIALSRPMRLDGLGCVHATLNSRVSFDEFAASITGTAFGSIDLYYLTARYGLEYTSKEPHEWKLPADIARQKALEHMGVEVDFVTTRQLKDARELELVAQKVSKKTRGYWRPDGLSPIEQRQAFLDALLLERQFPSGAGNLVV
ncbi:hypothetical protein [Tractidigestivibacter scatoligenes]|jgi:hypothetical protein|uniref:hypothetical protein n=1 Tax=Tractidigestivibacter scatoligenes TaxID=1299998 RepID=UPI002F34F49E